MPSPGWDAEPSNVTWSPEVGAWGAQLKPAVAGGAATRCLHECDALSHSRWR